MPREETPRYGLRRFVAALSVGIILLVGVGVPVAIVAPVPRASAEVSAEIQTATEAAKAVLPDFGSSAIGAVGIDGMLARSGPQTPRQMASVTKVITTLVVLEAKPLANADDDGPTITFGQKDVDILGSVVAANGSWEPVQVGWRTSERAAIETMLIPSANNYAESLAIWAYGSVPRFLVAARAFLKAHDLDRTTLVDTNGLSAEDTSTPSDLVELGKVAIADPVIATAVAKRTAIEPNVGELENTNLLLGRSGVNGLKTGTYPTGANLLFSAEVKVGERTVQLVGVILGAKDHPTLDARVPALLRSVKRSLHDLPLATKGQAFGLYRTNWGGVGKAVASQDVSRLVWGRAMVQRSAHIESITGGRKGERVGTVQYEVDGRTVKVPLVLDRDVLAAPVWWRLTHPIR